MSRRGVLEGETDDGGNRRERGALSRHWRRTEAAILKQIHADVDLSRRFTILASIPGVSAVTAFALLIEMPELGLLEAAQAASLAGLAPVARQSADGPDTPSSVEGEPQSVGPSTCLRWSLRDSTRT